MSFSQLFQKLAQNSPYRQPERIFYFLSKDRKMVLVFKVLFEKLRKFCKIEKNEPTDFR